MGDSKRVRRALQDWEKTEIALEWLRPLQKGQPRTPVAKLGEMFGREPAVISRAIKAAFREGLVELRAQQRESPIVRATVLETEIRNRFPRLHSVIVVNEPHGEANGPIEVQRTDAVHSMLGRAMADTFAEGGVLRDGDTICLGSGRGVYFSVLSLTRLTVERSKLPIRGATLVALTGTLFADVHTGHLGVGLDADFHVGLMGTCFAHGVTCRNVPYPIAQRDKHDWRKNTYLDEKRWQDAFGKKPPEYALMGVGILEGGHRFAYKKRPRILEPIEDDLDRLIELIELSRSDNPPYCSVADIGNHLFFLPPPPGIRVPSDQKKQIEKLIKTINKKLLTASHEQLADIQHIMLVAGTKSKGRVIRHLLDDKSLKIRTLCTDTEAARILIE